MDAEVVVDLVARVSSIHAKAIARQASAQDSQAAKASAAVVQLPLWPDLTRGVPNSILRSALFGVVRRGRRRYLDAEPVAAVDGITIRYTGQQLDQCDLDVWEQCLHLSRQQLGLEVRFAGRAFLRAVGRATGKSQREWLETSFRRLMSAVVEITDGRRAYAGHLIDHWYRDDATGQHVIVINAKIVSLYGSDGWTAVEWQQRLSLSTQLARWLHGFYASHAQPYPIKVETLRRLCGSECSRLSDYRSELRSALDELHAATGWRAWIDDQDLVHIGRRPTPSQARHLARRAARRKGA